jgi:uncharacterized protein YjdB
MKIKRLTAFVLAFMMTFTSFGTMAFAETENGSDITGHWAEASIQKWVEAGVVNGYKDGTFKPDKGITRAEFIKITNGLFGFKELENTGFSDVPAGAWYAGEVKKAVYEGFVSGYEDGNFKPNNGISRQEAAKIIDTILDMDGTDDTAFNSYGDKADVPSWSRNALTYMVKKGYLSGYPDKTLRPASGITRAETVSMLDRVAGTVYSEAGRFGPKSGRETVDGNVSVTVDGVTLQNMTINGDLHVTAGVGDGEATFEDVTVKGDTIINGGGMSTVTFTNANLNGLIVTKKDGKVRILIMGDTDIDYTTILSGAMLEQLGLTGEGFGNIQIERIKEGQTVVLDGDFEDIIVGCDAEITVTDNSVVGRMVIAEGADGASVDIEEGSRIEEFEANAEAEVTGQGEVERAEINAEGVEIEQEMDEVTLGDDVKSALVGGEKIIESIEPATSSSRRNSASNIVAVTAITVTGEDTVVNGETLQMGVEITPTNATNQTIAWSVATLSSGSAIIDSSTGLLTATGAGTVIVTAANEASGVPGTKEVSIIMPEPAALANATMGSLLPTDRNYEDGFNMTEVKDYEVKDGILYLLKDSVEKGATIPDTEKKAVELMLINGEEQVSLTTSSAGQYTYFSNDGGATWDAHENNADATFWINSIDYASSVTIVTGFDGNDWIKARVAIVTTLPSNGRIIGRSFCDGDTTDVDWELEFDGGTDRINTNSNTLGGTYVIENVSRTGDHQLKLYNGCDYERETISINMTENDSNLTITGNVTCDSEETRYDWLVELSGREGPINTNSATEDGSFSIENVPMDNYTLSFYDGCGGLKNVITYTVNELKEITDFTSLSDVTLDTDTNLVKLATLEASGELPTKVTVTDGEASADAAITDWTGTFDGTEVGENTLTASFTMPDGYVDESEPISPTIKIIVSTAQTKMQDAPIELAGVAPTSALNDGQITGTTSDMEYKLASAEDSAYLACLDKATTVAVAGDYLVRLAAKIGFGASLATEVTVPAYLAVTGVQVDQPSMILRAKNTAVTLIATVNPEAATDKTVTWSSSDEDVATVDNGVVTPLSTGTANITATTVDGSYTAACDVTVNEKFVEAIDGVTAPEIGVSPVSTSTDTNQYTGTVTWNPNDDTFVSGKEYTATITLIPKEGFDFTGIPANYFTVPGAIATNEADSGEITAVFPTMVANAADLYNVRNNVYGSYIQMADIDLSSYENWIPIVGTYAYFGGSYDGNGYEISNMNIDKKTGIHTGLFARTENAVLSNISIANGAVKGNGDYVGGLIGYSENTRIENCSSEGIVTGDGDYVGGLIGYSENTRIENCYSEGTVTGNEECVDGEYVDGKYVGREYIYGVGGLIGYVSRGSSISSCYSSADVVGKEKVGGLVGYIYNNGTEYETTITSCYATGRVIGTRVDGYYAGGLVGLAQVNTLIELSYATGNVSGYKGVGGLVGQATTIKNCYALGDVTGQIERIGGLAGQSSGFIENCFSAGHVIGGDTYTGGFIGNGYGTITNCYYDMEISGQSDTGKGIPTLTAEMMLQATFEGWDFSDTWTIEENTSYPTLK